MGSETLPLWLAERLAQISTQNESLRAFLRLDSPRLPVTEGSLSGLLIGTKDNIALAGRGWTAGLRPRADIVSDYDALLVAKLLNAGATVLGGLNMDEAALGAATDNPHFGRTDNPAARGFSTGGSSGGAAAAIAAGLVDRAVGSDTMGSVRIPASYCGIAALKPTFGLIGRSGLFDLAPSFDTVGIMADKVMDLWKLTQAIAGIDTQDPDSQDAPDGWAGSGGSTSLSGCRIGIPLQICQVECASSVLAALATARDAATACGATCVDLDLHGWSPTATRRAVLQLVEFEAAVSLAAYLERPHSLSPHLVNMLEYGRRLKAEQLNRARTIVDAATRATHAALDNVDAILTPTTPDPAFAHGATPPVTQADFTVLANASRCPAVVLPVPTSGHPVSVQLMSPRWSEARLLSWATALEIAVTP